MRRALAGYGFAFLFAGLAAAGESTAPTPAEPSLFLLGDAGAPDPAGEPVLIALEREVSKAPGRSVVVFLGDNVYPSGVPTAGASGRAEAERRLLAQIRAAAPASRTILLPGNHDWGAGRPDGWETLGREEALVDQMSAGRAVLVPAGGCPGPEVLDVGASLRLVALDTQWWLHQGLKPGPSSCAAGTEEAVVKALAAALDGAGSRRVAVLSHHPLLSGGEHGGSFTVVHHLFPLRGLADWLWLPLPLVGSAYPAARRSGISSQDLSAPEYKNMATALRSALAGRPPLLYASGHEHNVQVLDGRGIGPRYLLIAGGGIFGKTTHASRLKESLHASDEAGFLRVDFLAGKTRLTVFAATGDGRAVPRFETWLD